MSGTAGGTSITSFSLFIGSRITSDDGFRRARLWLRALPVLLAVWLLACTGSNEEASPTEAAATATTATIEATASASAGTEGRVAQDGDSVQVHYHGTLDDGEVFDSSRERDPLGFIVGTGQVIGGFDDAVRGLAVGESVKVRLEPADAYGEPSEDLVFEAPASEAPPGLSIGDQVRLQNGATAVVEEVTPEIVRLNANHPLAGQALTFEIELVAID